MIHINGKESYEENYELIQKSIRGNVVDVNLEIIEVLKGLYINLIFYRIYVQVSTDGEVVIGSHVYKTFRMKMDRDLRACPKWWLSLQYDEAEFKSILGSLSIRGATHVRLIFSRENPMAIVSLQLPGSYLIMPIPFE